MKSRISWMMGRLKSELPPPPVEGAANRAVIEFLAKILDIAPSRIEIIAGLTSRDKLISIFDLTPEEVHERIVSHLS